MLGFITLPTPSEFVASTSAWSTEIGTQLLPIFLAVGGIILGVVIAKWLITKGTGAIAGQMGRRKGRGRRR